MTTILRVNLNDLNSQFFQDLNQKFDESAKVEIRLEGKKPHTEIFSDVQFWQVIERLDWSKKAAADILAPATAFLATLPVASIYLFADKLSDKLYNLDTRAHGDAYLKSEGDDYLSVDDFLYVRCAVVAEGKEYYEQVLKDPSKLSSEISFEPLLSLADHAYAQKTGKQFDYQPVFNYETYSNKKGWM
ncbi:MAG: DUF4240 domain-containing protein [Phycisphaerae bacterium]|nr:DUF4240 domain-containing protein [Saprospiraceae bacterium]